jgi:AcrR family transcriptional regulator
MNKSKENIIKASLELFLNNSYAGVSMRDILHKAGLSRGAFYHYFESKEACFEECVKYYLAQVTHPEPPDYTTISLKAFLEDNIHRMSHISDSISTLDRLLFFNEAIKVIPDFSRHMEERNAGELAVWTKVVESAMETGEISSHIAASELAAMFISQCDGILMMNSVTMSNNKHTEVEKQWNNLYSLIKK